MKKYEGASTNRCFWPWTQMYANEQKWYCLFAFSLIPSSVCWIAFAGPQKCVHTLYLRTNTNDYKPSDVPTSSLIVFVRVWCPRSWLYIFVWACRTIHTWQILVHLECLFTFVCKCSLTMDEAHGIVPCNIFII